MEIRYHQEAERDIRAAHEYLQDRSPLTARKFRSELRALTEKLAQHPGFGFPAGDNFRKAAFRTLPWSVVYVSDEVKGVLWVMMVKHQAQSPSFGLQRRIPEGE